MVQYRDIYLRAHTTKHTNTRRGHRARSDPSVPKWPERVLIFDTETRTDVHQDLMFGIYRVCKLVGEHYFCESEGVVYSEAITKEELNQIGTLVSNTLAHVEVKQ